MTQSSVATPRTTFPPACVEPGIYTLPGLRARYAIGRTPAVDTVTDLVARRDVLGCDIETFGKEESLSAIKSVTFAAHDMAAVLDPRDPAQHEAARWALAESLGLVFHNSVFDVPALHLFGMLDRNLLGAVFDTVIYARLADPDATHSKGLEACALRYLGVGDDTESMSQVFRSLGLSKDEGYRTFDLDRPVYAMGAAADAIVTRRLLPEVRQAAYHRLTEGHPFVDNGVTGSEAYRLTEREQHLNRLFLKRSCKGYRIDFDELDRYRDTVHGQVTADASTLEAEGIRPGVGADLTGWLEDRGQLPEDHPRTKKTQRPSSTAKHLEQLTNPLAALFVRHKKAVHTEEYMTKVTKLAIDGRIHPVTNLLAATTGRSSMGTPPIHQFPGAARGIILADEADSMTSIDWSQIEPVVVANIAGEDAVLGPYEAGTSDLYTTLGQMTGQGRKASKTTLLALLYGEGLRKLAADLGTDIDGARSIRDQVFASMPKVAYLLTKLRRVGEQTERVFTVSGRILTVPWGAWEGEWSIQTHKAINYFVQGSAYDLLAEGILACIEAGLGDAIYFGMHDELVVSSDAAHDIRRIMERPPERLCRLARRIPTLRTDTAELGERWAAA